MYWSHAGETLILLGWYAQAEEYLKTAIDLNPSGGGGQINLALLYLIIGDVDKARVLLINNQNIDEPWMYVLRSQVELMDRNYLEAISILGSSPYQEMADQFAYTPKSLQLGLIYYMRNDQELANTNFHKALKDLEFKLNTLPDDARLYSSLGIVYAGLGMKKKALASGIKGLSIMNISVDAWIGFYRELDMARILIMIGEYDEAIAKLEFLLQQNGDLSVELLKRDPFWDPLRELNAFKVLIEDSQYQVSLKE
jgi:tetratricopeptide (TPR) repeat protein